MTDATAELLSPLSGSEGPRHEMSTVDQRPRPRSRRFAVATLLGSFLAGAGLTVLGIRLVANGADEPASGDAPSAQRLQGPWVPPATWDEQEPGVRTIMLMLDGHVHRMEAAGRHDELDDLTTGFLRMPGAGDLKVRLLYYIRDTHRVRWADKLLIPFGAGSISATEEVQSAALVALSDLSAKLTEVDQGRALAASLERALLAGGVRAELGASAQVVIRRLRS